MSQKGAGDAIKLKLAENYVSSLKKIAEKNQTIIVPKGEGNVASMMAQAVTMINKVKLDYREAAVQPAKVDEVRVRREVREERKAQYDDPILESSDEDVPVNKT